MTTDPRDERVDPYLWDRSAPANSDVQAVERQLAPLRYDPDARPLTWSQPAPRSRPRWSIRLAAAAAILMVAGAGLLVWRLSWPAGRPWSIRSAEAGSQARLVVGTPFEVSGAGTADVNVARIGRMQIGAGSRVTLQSTQTNRHRLMLDRGTVHVRVWAPPGSVVFRTPTGEVLDLGCEFQLTVNETSSLLEVRSGWVQLENALDESLIPAGASSEMRAGLMPGVPVFLDAPSTFATAVREFEAGRGDANGHLEAMVAHARARDVLTLLMLVERRVPGSERLASRAADLSPPPPGVTVGSILRGDTDGVWRWRDTLPLPHPKSWLRNWRDGLPSWLVGSAPAPEAYTPTRVLR
jgi:hypothetical protein